MGKSMLVGLGILLVALWLAGGLILLSVEPWAGFVSLALFVFGIATILHYLLEGKE